MDEDANGVRIKILPCPKEQFSRRMRETQALGDDFYMPNRAQLMLKFLQQHGDRLTKEKPGPKKRFPQHPQVSAIRAEAVYCRFFALILFFPPYWGVCVCVTVCVCENPDQLLRVSGMHLTTFSEDAGGQCMPDNHCPAKTLSVHGDIRPDQPDVQAENLESADSDAL